MYVVAVLFEAAPGHEADLLARVRRQAADSLEKEAGCHRFDVAVDPAAPSRIFLYELYDDRAAFDLHLASAHFADFDAQVGPWTASKRVETFDLTPPT